MTSYRNLKTLPKAHLHIHLEGAMRPTTLTQLCDKYNIERPKDTRGQQFNNFGGFNSVYRSACESIRTKEDLSRVILEVAEDAAGSGSTGTVTYSANAVVENYINYYVEMPLAGRAYVKLGFSQIDVLTKEDADHEGSYGDTSLDGVNYGVGIKGLYGPYQFKLSYETTDWDDLSLTSTTSNTISADLDNDELALSVAYRF